MRLGSLGRATITFYAIAPLFSWDLELYLHSSQCRSCRGFRPLTSRWIFELKHDEGELQTARFLRMRSRSSLMKQQLPFGAFMHPQ
jgi:hypothetical protein